MKVCIITNLYPPHSRGGAEQVVRKTVKGLIDKGHEVIVLTACPDGGYIETEGKLKIYLSVTRKKYLESVKLY